MLTRIRRFKALPSANRWIFLKAWFRLAILSRPFKRQVRSLQHRRERVAPPPLRPGEGEQAIRIGELVTLAARHTPWQSPCLAQVLAAQRLLAARGIPGQFHLGVRRVASGDGQARDLEAHAWLECGDLIVSGEWEHRDYTVVSTFAWDRA
jgi:hypothetical protein